LSNSAAFLVTATTNCVAAALGSGSASASAAAAVEGSAAESAAKARAGLLLGHALVLALGLGAATAATFALAPNLLLSLYGVAPGTPLAAASRTYLLVRTLSVPSIFLMFVAVGASLGAGNALAPTTGIMAAALVNLVGDVTLVMYFGAGLAGAAAATAAASWTGTIMVLARLRRLIKPRFRHVHLLLRSRLASTSDAACNIHAAGRRLLTWRRCLPFPARCCSRR
jgi:MATE family multidrug resistance protein